MRKRKRVKQKGKKRKKEEKEFQRGEEFVDREMKKKGK